MNFPPRGARLGVALLLLGAAQRGPAAEPGNTAATNNTMTIADVRQLLRAVPLIDGHNDVPWQFRKRTNDNINGIDLRSDTRQLHPPMVTDIPRLRAGGVGGQFWSVYIPATLTGSLAVRAVIEQIDVVHQMVAKYPDTFELALTANDIERIHHQGKIASLIGIESRQQCLDAFDRLPDAIVACVGGGSNAAGMFYPFVEDTAVKLFGVEAGGRGTALGQHAATLAQGKPGVLHGALSYVLQNPDGQTADVHSVSAGLDYPGVGPEHAYWKDSKRVTYASITDTEALESFQILAQREGIIPALESAHAVSHALKVAATMSKDQILLINLSGRGDKDCMEVARILNTQ